ncbi:MAG: phage head morphogenesis protein [Betaproteobacteria bacterium]|nr:phage head morphogenesis protein [Betaproteobacteria bacterium]
MPRPAFGFDTPFAEQLEFFKAKLKLPSERWDDIERAAHDKAFIVAGAGKADLVSDIHAALERAISEGHGIGKFRKDFRDIVQKHGWTGWKGEGSAAGFRWRTRVIYQTNMASSYAAGRRKQLKDPDFVALRPYWRYVHADGVMRPRLHHLAWGNARLTLRHDHPWWDTHYPPNGWGCNCYVVAVPAPGAGDLTEVAEGWDGTDGIDKGWDYAPGARASDPLYRFIDEKILNLDAGIGARMWEEIAPALAAEQREAVAGLVDKMFEGKFSENEAVMAWVLSPRTVADLQERGIPVGSAGVWLRDEDLGHAKREDKVKRGDALPKEAWRNLPDALAQARLLLDVEDNTLLCVFGLPDGGSGKLAVKLERKTKFHDAGKRRNERINFVRSGGDVLPANLSNPRKYVEIAR